MLGHSKGCPPNSDPGPFVFETKLNSKGNQVHKGKKATALTWVLRCQEPRESEAGSVGQDGSPSPLETQSKVRRATDLGSEIPSIPATPRECHKPCQHPLTPAHTLHCGRRGVQSGIISPFLPELGLAASCSPSPDWGPRAQK